jgi:malectin (di-glucose binding ER protein)/PA14 domain-containing protein/Kelch motif protein/glucose/sorbosone dehydrogenase
MRLIVALTALFLLAVPAATPSRAAETPTWHAEFFNNATLSGAAALVREDAAIDFDWGPGSPDPAIQVNLFSVRWSRTLNLAAGTYRFVTFTDDGVRLYIDGALKIDHFVPQSPTEWQADVTLVAGDHAIVMEYFENDGDAAARLSYSTIQTDVSPGTWKGEYFTTPNLTGEPLLVRGDPTIDFDWGAGGPSPSFPTNNFSVRWSRTLTLSAGDYRFATYSDDGMRVKIDGVTIPALDHFIAQNPTYYQYETTIAAGNHTFVVEYFESYGNALAKFSWARKAGEGIFRINAGGVALNGEYADSFNNFWEPDNYFVNANPTAPLTTTVSEEAQPIWNTTDDQLYINEHATAFRYQLPVPNGNYTVRLHFAELFFNASGVRRFNVAVQSTKVLSNFDIYAQAGKAALITRSFNTSVTTGTLTVNFAKVFDNAVLQALDVYPTGSVDLNAPTFAPIPEAENATYTTPPPVTIALADDVALNDGYWRLDDNAPYPLFSNLGATSFNNGGQPFTIPQDVFDALPLGAHTLSFGANDRNGNAWTQTWHFRKLNTGSGSVPIAFNTRTLVDKNTPGAPLIKHPTTLQVGPDGKLYIGQQDGRIHVVTLDANRNVVNVQVLNTIFNTPTPNADGSAGTTSGRQLLGLDFDPASTPAHPILWAVHSDLRFCFNKTPATCPVNPNSGILTRLDGPNYNDPANRKDIVTGLPRSRENHAPNAVHFGPDGWLYMSIGSDTNYGAPSTAFSGLPERYLTAGFVRINVNGAAASFPIDVRDVTKESDLKPGIFELYANGFRNPYDFMWHSNGKLYSNVNAGNFTAGVTAGAPEGCPTPSIDPGTRPDYLALVDQGDYGGNPNPSHTNQCVLDDGSMYSPPIAQTNPNYHAEKRLLYYKTGTSTNGMAEYTAPTFGGQMLHNIISANYAGNHNVRRVVLTADGKGVLFEEEIASFSDFGAQPLDVATGSDGSIYVGDYALNVVYILEPTPTLKDTGIWNTQTPLPTPTQEVGNVACNGKVYVLGGIVGQNSMGVIDTTKGWAYDPNAKTWAPIADYPGQAVDHPGAACVNGKVYLIGGLIRAGVAIKAVYAYDSGSNSWAQKADLPQPRGAQGVAVYGGKIYAVGGLGYPDKNDLYVYDPAANSWATKAPMPTARDHLIFKEVGGKLYAIGGRTAVTIQSATAANEVYDPVTDAWKGAADGIAPMPFARAAMAAGVLHGQIQIWGGEAQPNAPNADSAGLNPQGQMYDPKTNTWITIADELTPRHGTDGATINDQLYVPGGAVHQGNAATDANDMFAFVSTTPVGSCIKAGSDPNTTDSDKDGYTDKDELDNTSDPCSSAAKPPDNDGDKVSDLNDPDDDNDGVPDTADQFQFDAANGTATQLPWVQNWNPGDASGGKFANSGFPGVQPNKNGVGFYVSKVHVGGAGGFMSLDATGGTNQGSTNTQDDALQVGFDARQTVTIATRVADPFSGLAVDPGKSGGIYFGLDQDNYVKLVLASDSVNGKPGVVFAVENDGSYSVPYWIKPVDVNIGNGHTLDLYLILDPATQRVVAQYRDTSDDAAAIKTLGEIDTRTAPWMAKLFKLGAAAGVLSSNTADSPFGVAFDFFKIEPSAAPPQQSAPSPAMIYLPFALR